HRRNRTTTSAVSAAGPSIFRTAIETQVARMSQTVRTLGAMALGALIVAVAALSVRSGPVTGAPVTGTEPPAHTITVSASGKVTVVPDVARINLGITTTKGTVKAARESAAQTMTAIIAAIKGLGVADADIQTTNLSLYPQYGSGSTPKVVGYQISEQVQITVRDLDKAGDVVDAATAKGATDVNGISFELADPVKAQNDARASAVAAARTSAQAMAGAANVNLGAVVSITDTTSPSPIFYGYGAQKGAAVPDAATPVQPGTQDLTAMVTVIFEIN
ncbi:MAG TPA: SIMPL domain-containing protein, partial [Candidatus Limnocylindrales bacterium]